jgi:glycosyltransferase involved in cell wall biosynthesis
MNAISPAVAAAAAAAADVSDTREASRVGRAYCSRRLRIALLSPPWITVPPPGYGGIELVIAEVAAALVRRNHDVALLAPPGSRSTAHVVPLLAHDHPHEIGQTLFDVDHVGRALEVIDDAERSGRPFDVIHDHSGFALVAIANRVSVPVLHTVHGPFTAETAEFYRRHAAKVWTTVLSRAQLASGPSSMRCVSVIPNPIDLHSWPLQPRKDHYLLWLGRMAPDKGPHRAIAAARQAGWPLVLAGPVQPGQRAFFESQIRPEIDGRSVRYVAEVAGPAKRALFANAAALLMPIRWPEPFGMVMIEALACGTPVIAFPEGSAPEIVVDGESGFLVEDESEMATAVGRLSELDPLRCRATVQARYDVELVTDAYESAYRQVIAAASREASPRA